jgi:hypothetical protein
MNISTTYGHWNVVRVDAPGESANGMVICRWARHSGDGEDRYMVEWRHPTGHGAYDWYQGRSDMGLSTDQLNEVMDRVEDAVRRLPHNANPTMIRGMVSRYLEAMREEII